MLIPILAAASALAFQQPPPPPPPRQSRPTVVRDSTPPDTTKNRDAGRRLPVTAAVLATAIKDAETRVLFE
jgi:hypothetical protein